MPLPKKRIFFVSDIFYRFAASACALVFVMLVLALAGSLLWNSRASLTRFGLGFVSGGQWNEPFFEPSSASLRPDENTLILRFTRPPANARGVVLLQNGVPVPCGLEAEGKALIFTLAQSWDGAYSLTLPAGLGAADGTPLGKEIRWQGLIQYDEISEASFSVGGASWEPVTDENTRVYGILPFVIGSLVSSLAALCLAFPTALAAALFLTEFTRKNSPFAGFFAVLIDLLAGIPSIIYGMWGLFFVVPMLGANLLSASLILSVMTVPYATSLMRESISLVPEKIRHAGLALGASKSRLIFSVVLPYARSGIIAGVLLSLGRALGETLAVTMVIGNRNQIPRALTDPAQTIASLIANEYGEAAGLKQSALIEAGFVLIVITILFSLLGRWIIRRMSQGSGR